MNHVTDENLKKNKIAKLIRLSESNNENEAISALKLARKYCLENNLNFEDTKHVGSEECDYTKRTVEVFRYEIPKKSVCLFIQNISKTFPVEVLFDVPKYNLVECEFYHSTDFEIDELISIINLAMSYPPNKKQSLMTYCRKLGFSTKDVYAQYAVGFSKTVNIKFEEQNKELGLVIITPNSVLEMAKLMTAGTTETNFSDSSGWARREGEVDGELFGKTFEEGEQL